VLTPSAPSDSWKAVEKRKSSRQTRPEASASSYLFPYRLFARDSYLGDLECITSTTRKSTTRCERAGRVLILKKKDLFELIEEFPQWGEIWASAAWRRECLRKRSLKKLKASLKFDKLAAVHIQRFFRERKAARAVAAIAAQEARSGNFKPRSTKSVHQIWSTTASTDFSHKDLRNITSPNSQQTELIRQVDKLQRSIDVMHGKLHEVHSDMASVKQALQGTMSSTQYTLLFNKTLSM